MCISETVAAMFMAWNATEETAVRLSAQQALTSDVEFVDPDYAIRGLDPWVAMVLKFRRDNPKAQPRLASVIDSHHTRARYAWVVELASGTRLEGIDVVAFEAESCKIQRIDSFIGPLEAARGR
jgi:hypothetical protein